MEEGGAAYYTRKNQVFFERSLHDRKNKLTRHLTSAVIVRFSSEPLCPYLLCATTWIAKINFKVQGSVTFCAVPVDALNERGICA